MDNRLEEQDHLKPGEGVEAMKASGAITSAESTILNSVVNDIFLTQFVPPSVVVNYDLNILQFHGSKDLFFEATAGVANPSLLKIVRSDLEFELRNAVQKAIKTGEQIKINGNYITYKGNLHRIAFQVIPLIKQTKEKLLLIVFEEVKIPSPADLKASSSKDRRVKQLEAELVALREDMHSLIEEQEAANEQLQLANEEIVSSNEELHRINQELEISKKELESSNEELLTTNRKLQLRNEQLCEAQKIPVANKRVAGEELEKIVHERTLELQEANVNLERSNNDLAQFAYTASHDLQEPLRKIITFSTRLKERFSQAMPQQGREYVEKINFSADRMRLYIDDLLNFSRLTRFDNNFIRTDLNKVTSEVLRDFDLLIQEKNAIIDVGEMPVLQAIPLQMKQLFHNLLSNSLKFIVPGKQPIISITCETLSKESYDKYSQLDRKTTYHQIRFSDNGIGFSQKFADQIFIIFERLNDKEDYPGTGIGLALCRKIARNHGGEIVAQSEENKGATFFVMLPKTPVANMMID